MAGFTLIESLVALAVAAALLVVLRGLLGGDLAGIGAADADARAAMLAQARLDTLGTSRPLLIGVNAGRVDDRYRWREEVRADATSAADNAGLPLVPYDVRVTIVWNDASGERSFEVDSVRLVAAQ